MSERSAAERIDIDFKLDVAGDSYVASLSDGEIGAAILTIRLPREIVEGAVLASSRIELEVRTTGAVIAYTDNDRDLASRPVGDLIAEALEACVPSEEAKDLVALEAILANALARLRQIRGEQDA